MSKVYKWQLMMTCFRTVQFSSICMILQMGLVCSSFPDGTSSEKNDNINSFLPNGTNAKYQHEKSENDFTERNNFNLKQGTNSITAGSISKERGLFAISSYTSQYSTLQCETSIDMCGECGGTRVDQCNVCAGNNRCVSCNVGYPDYQMDACGNCIPPNDPTWNNCSAVISVHPLVLDKAVNSSAELKLELSKALEEGDSLECLVLQYNTTVAARVVAVDETLVTLSVPLLQLRLSESRLRCEGWSVPHHPLTVVDSLTLSVSSVTPYNISLGVPTQVKLMVHGISTPVDLFCFLINQNKTVLEIEPTNQIAGNPMSSTVVCPFTLTHPSGSDLMVGVSFTRAAVNRMSANNTIRISLLAAPLSPIRADFAEDLSYVWVEFNQNVDGPSNCSGVFKTSSLNLLGSGIKCEYRGNNLVVKLGKGATLRPRDVLRLSQNTGHSTGLRLVGSSSPPLLSQDTVHLPFTQRPLPAYLVVGPSKVCRSCYTSVVVVPLSAQELWYNWSLAVTEVQPWTQPQRQRHNLLVWFGAREILRPARHANLVSLPINSSLLMPNINYRIEVVAKNMLGLVGRPVRLDMQLSDASNGSSLGLVILSPPTSAASQSLPLEVRVTSGCGLVCLDQVKFQWRVKKDNQTITLDSRWIKATVPGRILQATGLYNITCVMTNNSIVVTQAETQVVVRPARIVLTVVPAALVMGTGHSLVLDVTKSLKSVNISTLQITWKCNRADGQECTSPGSGKPISISHSSVISRPKLLLPPGSLPVGRYQWSVVVRQQGSEYSSSADVAVVGGNPPLLTAGTPSIGPYLTLPASAQGLRPGCRLQWTSLSLLGYNFLPLNNVSGSWREVPSGTRGDLVLMVPARMLQPGAHYRLRFSAFCSAAESAYADFKVPVEPVPAIKGLQVSPLKGVALLTQFNFSTERSTEFGSTYSFGYYPPSGPPSFFYSSAYSLSTLTLLPVFSGTGSQIRTVARVCSPEQICSTQDGPLVQTSLPSSLSFQQTSFLSRLISSAVENGDPLEAVASATAVLSTTKLLADQTAHQSVSTGITEAILQKINLTSRRLEKDISTRPEAIQFLDSATRVLPLLRLNDSALSIVVAFRDELASTSKPTGNPARLMDSQLPMEPRASREKRQQPIPTETPPETPDTVEIWLRTSETAILSFSPSKSAEEKRKLLTNLDSYVIGLCQWLADPQPIYLGSQVVSLSVQKLSVTENFQKMKAINIPNCPEKCGSSPVKVYLGKDFIGVFKKANVEHICLSGLQFPSGSLDMIFSTPSGFIQLSAVYRLKLLTYSVSSPLADEVSPGVQLVIPLQSSSSTPQLTIRCCIVISKTWMAERCETVEVNESSITCKCPPYQYYSVFAVPNPTTTTTTTTTEMTTSIATTPENEPTTRQETTKTTAEVPTTTPSPPQTTTSPSTTSTSTPQTTVDPPKSITATPLPITMTTDSSLPAKKVAFRIAERFQKVVGQNSTEFSDLIKKQLIEQLGLPQEVIQDIYVTEGSILVTLALRNTQQLSAEECVMELAQALDTGQLNLRTADNQPLDVPRQPLVVLRQHSGEPSGLSAVFLASTTVGLCGLVVVYVTLVTLVTKHSRRREALRAVQRKAAEKIPRYSTLPLPHTLDGSSLRQGTWSGDDLDSGIYDSDGGKRNTMGKTPKQKILQTTNF